MLQWTHILLCRYVFEIVFLFSLGKYLEVKFMDRMLVLFLITVFHSGCTNIPWPQYCASGPFPHIFVVFFDNSHPDRCEVISHVVFIYISLMISDVARFHLSAIYVFFGKMSESSAAFKLDYLAFCYWVVGVPRTYWILTPYQIHDLQIFSPILRLPFLSSSSFFFLAMLCGMQYLNSTIRHQTCAPAVEARSSNHQANREFCFFTVLVVSFALQKLFSLISLLFIFAFVAYAFGIIYPEKLVPRSISRMFSLMLSSRRGRKF